MYIYTNTTYILHPNSNTDPPTCEPSPQSNIQVAPACRKATHETELWVDGSVCVYVCVGGCSWFRIYIYYAYNYLYIHIYPYKTRTARRRGRRRRCRGSRVPGRSRWSCPAGSRRAGLCYVMWIVCSFRFVLFFIVHVHVFLFYIQNNPSHHTSDGLHARTHR